MNGNNLLGRAEEIQLPQIKHKMAEHKALGMVGSAEFFAGIDKLECKIKWNALYPDVLRTEHNGMKRKFGSRHNSCPNSPTYRKYSDLEK